MGEHLIDELRAPFGCVDGAAGLAVLSHLDLLASSGSNDAALAAHVAGCAACAAEVADARAALAELPEQTVAAIVTGAPVAPTLVVHVSCVFCHDRLVRPEAVYCASCLAPHHAGCFSQHGRCAVRGCEDARFVRPLDVARAAPRRRLRWPWLLSAAALSVGAAALVADRRAGSEPLPVLLEAPPRPPVPPSPAVLDPVVATVAGQVISRSDVDHACALVPGYLDTPDGLARQRARLDALDRLIDDRAVLAAGRAVSSPPSELQQAAQQDYERLAGPYGAGFSTELSEAGLSAERVRALLLERRTAEWIVTSSVSRDAVITPADVQRYYADHLGEFQRGGEVRFRELVLYPDVRDGDRVPERVEPLVRRGAPWLTDAVTALRRELAGRSATVDLEVLAHLWSMDASAGQEQVFVASELDRALVAPLPETIRGLQPGQVSDPIELYTGSVHVIQLVSRRDSIALPLAEVEDQIRDRLVDERWRERCAEWVRARRVGARLYLGTLEPVSPGEGGRR